MASIGQEMLRDCLTAFVERRSDLAAEIIKRDKQVDEINRQLARELTTYMMEDAKNITRALNLLVVARSLERVADHAKNIAEEIYYLLEARDIRHANK
jgi:phosphate transport system protein